MTHLIDVSRSVVEPERQGSNGLTTHYCMTQCLVCGVKCGQRRDEWSQNGRGQWVESRKCSKCKAEYMVPLLPFEVKQAEVILADPNFANVGIECR